MDASLLSVSSSLSEIYRFRGDVDEVFALQGCYAAYVSSSLPTFREGYRPVFKEINWTP